MIWYQAAAASLAPLSIDVPDCLASPIAGLSSVPSRTNARRSEIFVAARLIGSAEDARTSQSYRFAETSMASSYSRALGEARRERAGRDVPLWRDSPVGTGSG
jgi:hypothetical protein